MRKLIKVTKKHIKEGQKNNPWSCPVACAIKDGVDNELSLIDYRPVVVASTIIIHTETSNINTKVPRSVDRFVDKFDNGKKPVKPFNFYLDI